MSIETAPGTETQTVAVVGASGLIGTRVVEELRARGQPSRSLFGRQATTRVS
jgi:nucleoside-diphosphate-sugar epimerase